MPEKNANKWMEFLKPLVVALIALATAATAYLQRADSSAMDSRMTALEVQVQEIQPWRNKVDNLLSDIRSDVSFIRGKMEAGK
jgi:hypothetical protein